MNIPVKDVLVSLDKTPLVSGEEKIPMTVGSAIANILLPAKEGGKMKLYSLADKAFNNKTLEVDEADLALIKKLVEENELYTSLVTGQLLIILENVK